MLDNSTYNLMETAAQISKGLHRYETFKHDVGNCQECSALWDHMKRADEQQLDKIVGHLKHHFQQGADAKGKAA